MASPLEIGLTAPLIVLLLILGSVAKGWLSTLCCWEAAVHAHV